MHTFLRRAGVLGVLLLVPASAHGATYTVDFQSGPPLGQAINNEYVSTAFVSWLADDPGYRPVRRAFGAHNIAGDIGWRRCEPEGGTGSDCEQPGGGTTFQLTRSATSVKLDVGLYSPYAGGVTVHLAAYRAGAAQPFATSPVQTVNYHDPATSDRFDTPLTVTSPAADIQKVDVVVDGPGPDIGIDNLVLQYPDDQVPDFSVTLPGNVVVLPQGGTVDVPVHVVRINGSSGNLTGSVAGLPTGVTATLDPSPVPGTQDTATLHLTAAADAAPDFAGKPITVTLKPTNANQGPAPRSATVTLSVRSPYDLLMDPGPVTVPACAPGDYHFVVAREFNFSGSTPVTLEALNLPAGVTARFVPGNVVAPGGGLNQDVTLRLTRPANVLFNPAQIMIRATAPGAPTRTATVSTQVAFPHAALDPTTLRGSVPSRLQPGALIRLNGNGFCPGTRVQVGNAAAVVDTEPDPDAPSTALSFRVPRLATSGPVLVAPPGAGLYAATPDLIVDSTRNTTGFQFHNPGWGNLSLGELTNLVGVDEMFLSVNPCWPWSDCSIPTPVPDPTAYLKWQIIEQMAQSSGGHCFGINRFVQEIGAGRIALNRFASGVSSVFELPGPGGPGESLGSYLDERHAGQFTAQFIAAWLKRSTSLSVQLDRARDELDHRRLPGIVLKQGLTQGHVVTAHDIETEPDGSTVVYLYDNETEFTPQEVSDRSGDTHKTREDSSRIVVNPAKTQWTYHGWSGGGSSFFTTVLSDWPAGTDPSLPGVDTITSAIIFGSAGGAAVTEGVSENADVLPALDANAVPGAAGTVVGPSGAELSRTVRGTKDGSYQQMFLDNGFLGEVDAPTTDGVTDRLTGGGRQIAFAGADTRTIAMRTGIVQGDGGRTATIRTQSFAGGGDTAGLRDDALVYSHDGPATSVQLTLESAADGRAPASFESAPLKVADGETLRVEPGNWQTLETVRVTTLAEGRPPRTRTLHTRAATSLVRMALSRLRVSGGQAGATLRVKRAPAGAVGGVTLRLVRRGKVVAKRGFGIAQLVMGTERFAFALPRLGHGRYVLRADAVATVTDGRLASRRVHRTGRVRL
jgi:hypothetical protein